MKKLTTSVLVVVLSSSFAMVNAQQKKDTIKTKNIEGVVITALGIKREKKSLGYASQEVKGGALTDGTTKTGNAAALLSGKAAGVQINSNNNFGGSTNIVIRGYKQLGGNGGSPLVVIDGSPISNTYVSGDYDLGNFLSDLNPDDIASMNILKGAAASALYGERALNGVIVIETKKGRNGKNGSWGVTLSTDVNFGFIDKSTFPTYQTRYGAGYGPYYSMKSNPFFDEGPDGKPMAPFGEDASYGAEFDPNLLVWQWGSFDKFSSHYGKPYAWTAAKNGPITFFDTPFTTSNSITLEKGNAKNNFMLSYNNFLSTGLMPNSKQKKNTFSARINYQLTDKLSASVYSTLTLEDTRGRNKTGYSDNLVTGFREWWQTNVDLQELKDVYFKSGGLNRTWNRSSVDDGSPAYWNNPYFQVYQNYESDGRTRNFSYAQVKYNFNKNFGLLAKVSNDFYNMLVEQRLADGSLTQAFGVSGRNASSGYWRQNRTGFETNFDVIGNYKFDISGKLNVQGIVGGNVRRSGYESLTTSTEGGLAVPGIYAISNSKGQVLDPVEYYARSASASAYASASFAYDNFLFVDATYRIDKSSNLPKGNNVYGYPSFTGALLLSDLIQKDWLNYLKLRANYAEVGSSTGNYNLVNTFSKNGIFRDQALFFAPSTLANPNLKPERSKEVELGIESKMFNNRFGFDVAVYRTKTFDQIINLPVSNASGYNAVVVNAGEIDNKGVEIQMNLTPIKTSAFTWDISVNWAKNINKLVSLHPDAKVLRLDAYQGGVSLNAVEGQAYGVLYGTDYVYQDGQKVVDPKTGRYLKTTESNKEIGNITPDWTGGIRNNFKFGKNFSMGFLIDVQHGGSIFSTDMYYGLATGLYQETAVGDYRTKGVVHPGVNPDGKPNQTYTAGAQAFGNVDGYRRMPNKRFVYDASYIKLREANITYKLPKYLIANTFLEEAKISLVGRNLWIIYKNLPYADPEGSSGGGLQSRGSSVGVLPTTRDIGVNVTLKF
ncbi:SusC/RagA family TonB-linked outer membrane protein [Riemerella columbipharyngis]|uniref:TonB-linked outer membrane protein, SusC/RagA family n=1 Tax=Riemerella columbipharyngis TaxID=1071918 RepID=A0A1G6YBH0_9FLAO|nr:SusC/RagA family TonB-linked outer membrane protein [Riemerella columbipharyngis]SDD87682.1 TonB-linked outer membrane protein, SusC/RagA family [Riemerella columbipharyngis]